MLALSKDRELRSQWQRAAELLLAEADVAAFSKAVDLPLVFSGSTNDGPGVTYTDVCRFVRFWSKADMYRRMDAIICAAIDPQPT
jgi:hypothetical protein